MREQLFRYSTSLRRGGAVAELWPEGNRLWLWKRMRKWTRPKNRKMIDLTLENSGRLLMAYDCPPSRPTLRGNALPDCQVVLPVYSVHYQPRAIQTLLGPLSARKLSENHYRARQSRIPLVSPTMAFSSLSSTITFQSRAFPQMAGK